MTFKILGNADDPLAPIDEMTKGIGFAQVPVENANPDGNISVKVDTVIDSASFVDQNPTGIGVATQIVFGDAFTTAEWLLGADGSLTCLETDEYTMQCTMAVGREGGAQESRIYSRLLIDGVQTGNSTHTIVDNARIEIPQFIAFTRDFTAGQVITFEFIRDTDGHDSGGLRAGNPDVAGWNSSPSAAIRITRTVAVET